MAKAPFLLLLVAAGSTASGPATLYAALNDRALETALVQGCDAPPGRAIKALAKELSQTATSADARPSPVAGKLLAVAVARRSDRTAQLVWTSAVTVRVPDVGAHVVRAPWWPPLAARGPPQHLS